MDNKITKKSKGLNQIKSGTNIAFNIIFIILSLMCIVPVIFVFIISISSEASLAKFGYRFIPAELSDAAYIYLWKERLMILKAVWISVIVTVSGTLLGLGLTTSMGYVLSRKSYKLQNFYTWVIFIPMIFNGGLAASYVVNDKLLNLSDTLFALILPLAVSSFNIIICKTFFKTTIPDSVIESAKIDGATQIGIFSKIVLPISKPVIATIGLFLSFGYWNDWFLSSLYIRNKNLISIQALLNSMVKNIQFLASNPDGGVSIQQYLATMPRESVRMAIAIVIVVPIACAYPFFQRYFVTGLTIGAVKG
nr:carbohydrate ABC transporter permease [uncultured Catonella sp.]